MITCVRITADRYRKILMILISLLMPSWGLADGSAQESDFVAATRPAIDINYAAIGGPTGAVGFQIVLPVYENWAADVGYGNGFYGKHVTANARYYLGDSTRRQRYFLLGGSYSNGYEKSKDKEDRNHNGIIEDTAQLADAFWVNAAWGFTLTSKWGFRYGMELGVTATVGNSWKRKNIKATEDDREVCGFALSGPTRARNGIVWPSISLLKVGYSF